MNHTVLIVDDDPSMCSMLELGLSASGYSTSSISTANGALKLLHDGDFDAVVTDVRMRKGDGLQLCNQIVSNRPDIPVIVMTAFGSMEIAIEAIRAGAYDFVAKPFNLDSMRVAVKRAIAHRSLAQKIRRLEHVLESTSKFNEILGSSQAVRALRELIERVARSEATVLICGESGTGKELVARALHRDSARGEGPFMAINCAAMPQSLLESELFGHLGGAFTDARSDRKGLFQQAEGGTLFLDEIDELPLSLQPKLLRALQERRVRPLGASQEASFDARIVTATNRNLEAAVHEGKFRRDLYYRIHVIQLDVPPLRERENDILLLAQHFLRKFSSMLDKPVTGILPSAAAKLVAYPWPGNVRELENCIERAVILSLHSEISPRDLPTKISRYPREIPPEEGTNEVDFVSIEEVERRHVLRVFAATGQNKSRSARILGVNRKTLYRKLRQYGALPPDDGNVV